MTDDPNPGRSLAYEAFCSTLNDLLGKAALTEARFRDSWLARLEAYEELSLGGWYDPPPHGIGVIFGAHEDPQGFSCSSLRPPERWPSERKIVWEQGLMYAYCSPVHVPTGLPGDFGVTLYFGRDDRVRRHFASVVRLAHAVLDAVTPQMSSRELFRTSQQVFTNSGYRSNVSSVTDSVPVDLGHSLPRIPGIFTRDRTLGEAARNVIRNNRLFISESRDWPMVEAGQVTIEPALVSVTDPMLPQVSPHYVLDITADRVVQLRECDDLLEQFGLAG